MPIGTRLHPRRRLGVSPARARARSHVREALATNPIPSSQAALGSAGRFNFLQAIHG
jgi:hypothetical protein